MPEQSRRTRRSPIVAQWLVVGGVLLTGVLAARTATLGLGLVTDGPSSRPDWVQPPRSGPPLLPIRPPTRAAASLAETPPEPPGLMIQAGLRVLDAALIICAVVLLIGVVRIWERSRRSGPSVMHWSIPEGVPDPLELRTLIADALEADDILDGKGSPRNAIVECWLRLERIGSEAGVPQHRADTTTEYVVRLMQLVQADSEAVTMLAALFGEARFSQHELTSEAVASAHAALRAIRSSLRPPTRTGG